MNFKILIIPLLLIALALPMASAVNPCGNVPTSVNSFIASCYPVNIINQQGIATVSGFQVALSNTPINAIGGLVVFYNGISGSLMPAWIESNSVIWVNLKANTIGISSSANGVYYLGVGSLGVNFFTSNNPANDIGEAPQLSSTYAQYDNGNLIFSKYWNFVSALPAGFNSVNVVYTASNGLAITAFTGSGGYVSPTFSINTPYITDFYGNPYYTGGASIPFTIGGFFGLPPTTDTNLASLVTYASNYYGQQSTAGGSSDTSSNLATIQTSGVWTNYAPSNTILDVSLNYTNTQSVTADAPTYPLNIGFAAGGAISGITGKIYWYRTRIVPPNGALPTIVYGHLTSLSPLLPNAITLQTSTSSTQINGPTSVSVTYPIKFYSNNNLITYTLNSIVGASQTTVASGNAISFVPPATQPSGTYTYGITEYNGTTLNAVIMATTNMVDIVSPLAFNGICSVVIQDGVNCANVPDWNAAGKPTYWNIQSDNPLNGYGNRNTTGPNNIDAWSNGNLTFAPNIILTYGQFSPALSFPANIENNPQITSITQSAMAFIASNSIPRTYQTRLLYNTTTYDQQFLTPLNAVTTTTFNWYYNNYTGIGSVKEPTNITQVIGGNYALNSTWMANSFYSNPPIVLSNLSTVSTAALHYSTINNFFSNTINYGTRPTYPIYLANNANASLYTFYVYACSGYASTGIYLSSSTGVSSSYVTPVQQYRIGSIPFSIPLQNGQQYQFQFYTPSGGLFYTQPLTVNPLTISIYTPCLPANIPTIGPIINASCAGILGLNELVCSGSDVEDYVTSWNFSITYHPTILSTSTLYANVIPGPSFNVIYTLPNRTIQFFVTLTATVGRNSDPLIPFYQSYAIWGQTKVLAPTPSFAYDAIFFIVLFFLFISVAYVNEIAAIVGLPIIIIFAQTVGIFNLPDAYVYGMCALGIIIAILLSIHRD